MPDKELTPREHRAVKEWLVANEAYWWKGFREDHIIGSGVYRLKGEPLVLSGRTVDVPSPDPGVRFRLFCSDKHALMLKEAGVLSFQETPLRA